MQAGKDWGLKVNCIYAEGKCGLLFANGNVGGICFGWGDLWKTMLKVLGKGRILLGNGVWKTLYIIKRKETEVPERGFGVMRKGFGLRREATKIEWVET